MKKISHYVIMKSILYFCHPERSEGSLWFNKKRFFASLRMTVKKQSHNHLSNYQKSFCTFGSSSYRESPYHSPLTTHHLLLAIFISLAIVWGIVVLPLADSALDASKLADQHFEKVNELLKQERHEAAIAEYKKAIKLVPKSKIAQDAQYWVGQSYFRMGEFDKALSIFENLIVDYPKSAIVPVTKLMISRAQQEKENAKRIARSNATSDTGVIVDPKTGIKYTKIKSLTGKSDLIQYNMGLNLSPNGKFLLWDKLVIPLDGSEPFDLVGMPASRGTWSPDGKNVAFYSEGIWVVPVSPETGRPTGPAKKLLDGEYWYQSNVSWSPDSERIVFERMDKEYRGDIWTLSVRDSSLRQITNDPGREYGAAWSPDGKTIAYLISSKGSSSIWLTSAEGGTSKKIIDTDSRAFPFWTPDSKWIFFSTGGKLRFLSPADKREFDIILPRELGDFLSWSTDGKKMLFYHPSYDWKSTLKVVSSSGGPSLELGGKLTLWPVDLWSPDSKMIITAGENEDGDIVFWIVPLAGGEPFLLEMDASVAGKPFPVSVSPDTRKLAFVVRRDDGTEDLWVVPISVKDGKTTGLAVMVFGEWIRQSGYNAISSWAPDGTKLAIIHRGDIWVVSAGGGKPVQITKTQGEKLWPVWSPNGKMVAYIAYPTKGEGILYVIPISGGEATKVLEACDAYAWYHDSKALAVLSKGLVSVVPIAGGKPRQILDLKELNVDDAWGLRWSPDGQNLAFIGRRKAEDKYQIFIVPTEGGKATELAADDHGDKYFLCWSPDGKWIAYNSDASVKTRPEGAIWEANVIEILSKME